MSLAVRDDDAALLEELQEATTLGRLVATPPRDRSRAQVRWVVTAKADCLRLVEILNKHPLRGRKSRDYAIWSAAVEWWVDGDPTKTQRNRDWSAMTYLKERLQEGRKFPGRGCFEPIHEMCRGLDSDWPEYVAGLVTADGSLGIHRNGASLLPKAQITLRSDDLPLLDEIAFRTRVGRVYESTARGTWGPQGTWIVRRAEELESLVHLLDKYPPRGRRGAEYDVWREAALLYVRSPVSPERRTRLIELRERLARVRGYDRST